MVARFRLTAYIVIVTEPDVVLSVRTSRLALPGRSTAKPPSGTDNSRQSSSGAQAASANAYAAGAGYPLGAIYPVLPAGCEYRPILRDYECPGVWFKPSYGANGIYYRVVPAP